MNILTTITSGITKCQLCNDRDSDSESSATVNFLRQTEKAVRQFVLDNLLIFELLICKSNLQPNFDQAGNPEF